MMKWAAPRPTSSGATRRFHVKVKPLKLQGLSTDEIEKPVTVEMKWNRPKSVFVPFYRSSSRRGRYRTSQRFLGKGDDQSLEWDDEFENICDFSIASKDGSFGSWDVLFRVLVGESTTPQTKLVVLGKASLNLAEVAATTESEVERKVPIISKVGHGHGHAHGVVVATEAMLSVCVRFAEVRDCQDSPGPVQNSTESDKGDAFFKRMMGLTGYKKKKDENKGRRTGQASSCESDESGYEPIITSDSSSNAELSSRIELGSTASSETQLETVRKDGFFSWKRRRLSFRPPRKKGETLTKKSNENKANEEEEAFEFSSGNCEYSNWEEKELVSRDGQSRLKASVFFASFDQRSEEAAGESACTALVAAIANWLHLNQDFLPTRAEYDRLITQGSSDWRKLCSNEAYLNFPDKHFDLETVLGAGLQPITVSPEKSFTGFFSPEKFESLKGTMSFDEIWDEINNNADNCHPGIYIVSWNDHFFVLKVEADAYYIIDSLGERLFEGCNQAYILKFDDSTLMYGKVVNVNAGEGKDSCKEESEKLIYRGKECCKEYIKRFLAAIPLGELELEVEKGTASPLCLYQRLQIDFHYSSSSASSSSSSPTTYSTFSSSPEKSETNFVD